MNLSSQGDRSVLACIDTRVEDYQSLVRGVLPGVDVILLDPNRDGVHQITEALQARSGIQSLQIVAHGSPGQLHIGAGGLSYANVGTYAAELQQWASFLSENANILVYGCQVAAGTVGRALVHTLATVTGKQVAAASHLVGNAALGGSWALDINTGPTEATLALHPRVMRTYGSVLASITSIGQATFASNYSYSGTTVGGLSGITYDPINNRYYAISDAKNDANGAVRFYTLTIDLSAGSLSSSGVNFTGVTTLKDAGGTPFAANVTDTEGIALTGNGNVFIASEGMFSTTSQPFVRRFDLATGTQNLSLSVPTPKYDVSASTSSGIRSNRGFESMTLTPDGRYLFTATEVALEQDGAAPTGLAGSPSRIVRFDLLTGEVDAEFLYNTDVGNGISDLLALDANTLLVLDRNVSTGVGKLYQISLQNATNIKDNTGLIASGVGGITPAQKTLVSDLSSFPLGTNFEGMTFGPALPNGKLSLILLADNNFGGGVNIPTGFVAFEFQPDNPFLVTNTNDSGIGSLRQAILYANASAGTDTITFAIPTTDPGYSGVTGQFAIALQSALPILSDAVIVDGTSQSGFSGTPLIYLDGTSAGQNVSGLTLTASNSTIKGLGITDFSKHGLVIQSSGNTIGGTDAGNVITHSGGAGISVETGTQNAIRSNSIYDNTGLGIDLGATGVTTNDATDSDSGANDLQNFPLLIDVITTDSSTLIYGSFNSTPSATFTLQFFSNPAAVNQDGEGQTLIGATSITTDETGAAVIRVILPAAIPVNRVITATAIASNGSTSEFSAGQSVTEDTTAPDAPPTPTLSQASDDGSSTSDRITSITTPTLTGTAEAYSSVELFRDSTSLGSTTADQDGNWSLTPNALPIGTHSITAKATDFSGNVSAPSQALSLSVVDSATPTLSIDDVTVTEGTSGTTTATFTISLSHAIASSVSVQYSTANNTATAPDDYTAATGTLTFPVDGSTTTQTLSLTIQGDSLEEGAESFWVTLSNPTNATIADGQGTATILNDDNPPPDLRILGTESADLLQGRAGNDTLRGLAGHDTLRGWGGHDWLYGDSDRDTLVGGSGNDKLLGGTGSDTLVGGDGRDRFIFSGMTLRSALTTSLMSAPDRITDFSASQGDKFQLDGDRNLLTSDRPKGLFNAGLQTTSTLQQAIVAAYDDKHQRAIGDQRLGLNEAVFFSWKGRTYLSVNNGQAGFSANQDLLTDVTGIQFKPGDATAGVLFVVNYFV